MAATVSLTAGLIEAANRAASAGRRDLARQHYESALYLLQPGDGATAAMILRRVGRTHLDDGDVETGLDCLSAALAVAEACGDVGQRAHTINVIAISHWQRADLDEAVRLYSEAGGLAQIAGDDWLVAMIEQNLGIIASTRAEHDRALRHYQTSLERYRSLGLESDVARLLNNVGMVYVAAARWEEADRAYAEACDIATRCGDTWARLMVEVNRAAMSIARGDHEQARTACDRVLADATAIHDTRLLAETHKYRGIVARELLAFADAERHLGTALEQALARQDFLLAAETAREQAELFLKTDRSRDALHALSQAHRLFSRISVPHELANVSRRMRQLEQRFHDIVRRWAQSIELKDPYTLGHSERVADHACAIASDCGFDEPTMFWFRVGALLHDVGKIVVPEDILHKAGPLTPRERRLIEQHPIAGVELLADVDFPWDVLPMVRGHHERWDGHGYPDQLAGEEIPLAARILAVADVFDALTTDRPYRPALSRERALALMTMDSGRMFDPEVLARFVRVIEDDAARSARNDGVAALVGVMPADQSQGAAILH